MRYILPGAVSSFLLFHFRYGLMDGKSYSFSAIASADELILYCALTAITAFILGFVVTLLMRPPALANRWDAFRRITVLTLSTMYLWFIPYLWNVWLNGFLPTWTLPQIDGYFWGLLSLICLLFTGAAGLLCLLVYPQLWYWIQKSARKSSSVST